MSLSVLHAPTFEYSHQYMLHNMVFVHTHPPAFSSPVSARIWDARTVCWTLIELSRFSVVTIRSGVWTGEGYNRHQKSDDCHFYYFKTEEWFEQAMKVRSLWLLCFTQELLNQQRHLLVTVGNRSGLKLKHSPNQNVWTNKLHSKKTPLKWQSHQVCHSGAAPQSSTHLHWH